MTCADDMCWQEPLCEAVDYWKAENERLREAIDWALAEAATDVHECGIGALRALDIVREALASRMRTGSQP